MAQPLHRQLLTQSRRLARLDSRRPQQANLRRAVSSAYYALFHFLADRASRDFLGTSPHGKPFRDILARAFMHTEMKNACRSFAAGSLPQAIRGRLPTVFQVSSQLQRLADAFVSAQEARHLADYDPGAAFSRSDVLALIVQVEQAIDDWTHVQANDESRFFLACLLTWNRLCSRT